MLEHKAHNVRKRPALSLQDYKNSDILKHRSEAVLEQISMSHKPHRYNSQGLRRQSSSKHHVDVRSRQRSNSKIPS